ncbi:PREDICTED: interferon-inducible GTPase 1-like [Elephantulus edwardii]|uniref:interferon-inducible GTPase 1-like n=1 Tax=Elephantulus edwardii TaxID=28737 RepID=UPI0003F0DF4B|nr:PREDICTED: interferon-inducible GTPase 1-like [Elephantulus edwardii]
MGEIFSVNFYEESYKNLVSGMDAYFQDFKNSILMEETIELIKSKLLTGNVDTIRTIITDVIGKINSATVNIAVVGESGSGKSSFISALRNVKREETQVTATGMKQTTMEPIAYKHPKFPNVVYWDLPDIETTHFQPKEYLEKVKFGQYDFLIILSATHFKENYAQLAKEIKQMNKNVYFVRSKVDINLQNEHKCNPKSFDKEKVLQQIRDNCLHCFRNSKMDEPQIFLVSNNDLADYDFPLLTETLLKNLTAQKRYILLLSLPCVTDEDIERKKNSLRQKIWLKALKAGLLATLPMGSSFSDNDVKNLKARIEKYRALLGVDDASLQNLAQILHMPMENVKKQVKSPNLLEEKKDDSLGDMVFKYLEKICSTSGGLLATGLYFRKIYYMQLHILDTVTNDAKNLLKMAVEKKRLISQQDKLSEN